MVDGYSSLLYAVFAWRVAEWGSFGVVWSVGNCPGDQRGGWSVWMDDGTFRLARRMCGAGDHQMEI